MAGFLSALFSSGRSTRDLYVDVILMTALADGHLSQAERDQLGRLMKEEEALQGLDWNAVLKRAKVLAVDAPMFSEARAIVAKRLTDRIEQRQAIVLAAQLVGADRALQEEEQAILLSIAQGFGMDEGSARAILEEAAERAGSYFIRAGYNNPRTEIATSLFDAIETAESDELLGALMFKPLAIRYAMTEMMEGGKLVQVGERLEVGLHHFRVDGTVATETRRWLIRCIAPGEALHSDEHTVMRMLVDQLKDGELLVIVHRADLSTPDDALVRSLDEQRVVVLKV